MAAGDGLARARDLRTIFTLVFSDWLISAPQLYPADWLLTDNEDYPSHLLNIETISLMLKRPALELGRIV